MLEDLLKKYKSIAIALLVAVVVILILQKFHNFYKAKINRLDAQTLTMKKKIDLGQEVSQKQIELRRLKQRFISTDSYAFIELISRNLRNLDLDIISIKPLSVSTAIQRSKSKSVVKRMILDVNIKGDFEDLKKFFKRIDEERLNITIFHFSLEGEKGDPDEVLARVKLLGLAIKEP